MAIRKSNNWAFVEGKLAEVDLQEATYMDQPVIRGSFTLRVVQTVEGKEETSDIPIFVFAKETTNAGKPNKAYQDLLKILREGKSIATVGLEEADTYRSSGGQASMNEYFTSDGRFVSFERVSNNFADKVTARADNRAYANIEGYIVDMGPKTDAAGEITDTFEVKLVNINWAGEATIIPIITNRKNIAEAIENTFQVGSTIEASVFIRNTTEIEEVTQEVEIGDPIVSARTRRSSAYVISSIKAVSDDLAYSDEEIAEAVAQRKTRLEGMKAKAANAPKTSERQAPKKGVSRVDLGF